MDAPIPTHGIEPDLKTCGIGIIVAPPFYSSRAYSEHREGFEPPNMRVATAAIKPLWNLCIPILPRSI